MSSSFLAGYPVGPALTASPTPSPEQDRVIEASPACAISSDFQGVLANEVGSSPNGSSSTDEVNLVLLDGQLTDEETTKEAPPPKAHVCAAPSVVLMDFNPVLEIAEDLSFNSLDTGEVHSAQHEEPSSKFPSEDLAAPLLAEAPQLAPELLDIDASLPVAPDAGPPKNAWAGPDSGLLDGPEETAHLPMDGLVLENFFTGQLLQPSPADGQDTPVRPQVLTAAPHMSFAGGSRAGALRVYSRSHFRTRPPSTSAHFGEVDAAAPSTPVLPQLERARKPTDSLLPLPVIHMRCVKAAAPGSLPRRSRRVAGVDPCSLGPVTTEAQRRVMRSLGFACKGKIDLKTQDVYFKIMGSRLTESRVAAMAAIFGWNIEEDAQVRVGDFL
ncbi:uncharacterized protein [Miscanthus floridulus]|uniref:uncharacterized protein n=1 Tax=Miscanthus floridulus TaxID=154761 RepID=UPI003459CEFE